MYGFLEKTNTFKKKCLRRTYTFNIVVYCIFLWCILADQHYKYWVRVRILDKVDNYFYSGWQFLFLLQSELICYHFSRLHFSRKKNEWQLWFPFLPPESSHLSPLSEVQRGKCFEAFSLTFHAYGLWTGLGLWQVSHSMLLFWHFTTFINESYFTISGMLSRRHLQDLFYSKNTHPLKIVLLPSVSISVLSQLLKVLP